MKIEIITPAKVGSLSGNRATAKRWAAILQRQKHRVAITTTWSGNNSDLVIALHAWRSAASISDYKNTHPQKPLILALTGTDLYRFLESDKAITLASIEAADYMVSLHDFAYRVLPQKLQSKVSPIYQSATTPNSRLPRTKQFFDVCVVGHLREEKDSLRTAMAVRDLPACSRIRVQHYGKAHTPEWAELATDEMTVNPRYKWYGEVPHWRIRRIYQTSQLMVLSSIMEGGANVISEAVAAGLPVIASDIDGSVGLLGKDYPGYYAVTNTQQLQQRLLQAESDPNYLQQLKSSVEQRQHLFTPEAEAERWQQLIAKVRTDFGV